MNVRQTMRPLQPYIDDPSITELQLAGKGQLLLRRNGQWEVCMDSSLPTSRVEALIAALLRFNGLPPGPNQPVKFPDGQRGQIVAPPALQEGERLLILRKHDHTVRSLRSLQDQGAFAGYRRVRPAQSSQVNKQDWTDEDLALDALLQDGNILSFLQLAVTQRRNIVIAGATASGKTTFARSLMSVIPPDERLITIEDVHELHLPNHRNKTHLIYGAGLGRINATECIGLCMRLSPDRILLSELRGNEAWDYLTALNTGHPGAITTTHANNTREAFGRVAMLIKQSGVGQTLDMPTISQYLRSTIHIVLYMRQYALREVWFEPVTTFL